MFRRVLSGPPTFTLLQLGAALHLSTMWGFDAVREYAIKEIDQRFPPGGDNYDPFDRLDLADRTNVAKWRRPAFEAICNRSNSLTLDDGRRLGIERLVVVSAIRERCRPSLSHPHRCNRCGNRHPELSMEILQTALDAEKESLELE